MPKLKELLLDGAKRAQVVQDCATLVDDEVAQKGGLSGLAVKGAYGIVKRVKPGLIAEVVDKLLNEFVDKLEPFYADFQSKAGAQSLAAYWVTRSGDVANALLAITDARAEKADNNVLKGAYKKLRPSGVKHVQSAVPGIARVINKHV
jgi:hypothetical protein